MSIRNVLLVDDSILTQKQLSKILEEGGYRVKAIAQNGVEAVNKFKELKDEVDLVTLDITMPEMDGIEVLEKIFTINPHAKVIMVSAMGKENTVQRCLSMGAKSFIIKPFYKSKILETIEHVGAQ
ncbi:MAG: response regulator [Spirochaetia bacterium]|nr:response regulator [Spirochaetia bacterium]